MAEVRELERGIWLDDSLDADTRRDIEGLCHLLSGCVSDAVVCLAMFEQGCARARTRPDMAAWERDGELYRAREAELEAEDPRAWGTQGYREWHDAIRERARRDVQRTKWAQDGGPEAYKRRLPFIHARSFVNVLAQLRRGLVALTDYELGEATNASIRAGLETFDTAVPGLVGVRDSSEHAEDRVRWRVRNQRLEPGPVENQMIHAPGGGALVMESISGRRFGGTIADGTYAEVDVADGTTEVARAVVQAVFDVLPWRPGHRLHEPYS